MTAYTEADMKKARWVAPCSCLGFFTRYNTHKPDCVAHRQKDIAAALAAEREAGVCQAIDVIELSETLPHKLKMTLTAAIRARGK